MVQATLKPCPCGKTPTRLSIGPGSTFRWRYVGGDCGCGWETEVRINTMRPASEEEDYADCVRAWNEMERA